MRLVNIFPCLCEIWGGGKRRQGKRGSEKEKANGWLQRMGSCRDWRGVLTFRGMISSLQARR